MTTEKVEHEKWSDDWISNRAYELASAYVIGDDRMIEQADDIAKTMTEMRDAYHQRIIKLEAALATRAAMDYLGSVDWLEKGKS